MPVLLAAFITPGENDKTAELNFLFIRPMSSTYLSLSCAHGSPLKLSLSLSRRRGRCLEYRIYLLLVINLIPSSKFPWNSL